MQKYSTIYDIFFSFPSEHFGFLFGLSLMLSGIFGFLQHLLLVILLGPLDKNPFWVRQKCKDNKGKIRREGNKFYLKKKTGKKFRWRKTAINFQLSSNSWILSLFLIIMNFSAQFHANR